MLNKAIAMFEVRPRLEPPSCLWLMVVTTKQDFLQYSNHLGLCTEEISDAGEALGNAVQGFTYVVFRVFDVLTGRLWQS